MRNMATARKFRGVKYHVLGSSDFVVMIMGADVFKRIARDLTATGKIEGTKCAIENIVKRE